MYENRRVKLMWVLGFYKVQYGYSKKIVIFSELWKVDLGPFGNKLFKYNSTFYWPALRN